MPTTLPSSTPARPRLRAIAAVFALVGALLATSAPLAAAADPVGTISGTVTSAVDGLPVSNVLINVVISAGQGTSFSESVWTDAQGAYAFSGLEPETYGLNVYAPGFQNYPWQDVTLTAEAPSATIDIVLQPFATGSGVISGTVTADGVPASGLFVSAYETFSGQSASASTDESGAYEITGLANGQWTINTFAGPQYQFPPVQTVHLTDAAPTATVDIALLSWPTGTASITGVLTDSATGSPVAGASISVFGVDVAHNSTALSDENGVYSVDFLPAGTFLLSITGFTTGYLYASREVTVLDSQAVTADFALIAASSTITGHVKDTQGNPIAGTYVFANSVDGTTASGTLTDENGDYVVTEVGALAYTVTVGGVGTPYKEKSKVVTPAANGSVTANFTLKPRTTGSLGGFVNGPDGQPYNQPVCVNLHSSKNKKVIAETVTLGPDFGDGSYSFADLKPGSYTVSFEDCDADPALAFDPVFFGGVKKYADATFITIAAAEDSYYNDFTLSLRQATSTISGHVEKGNGTALAGLTVTAVDGNANVVTAVTDANGDYTITGLFTGRHTVTVGGDGTLYKHKQKHLTTVDNGDVTANFTLAKK